MERKARDSKRSAQSLRWSQGHGTLTTGPLLGVLCRESAGQRKLQRASGRSMAGRWPAKGPGGNPLPPPCYCILPGIRLLSSELRGPPAGCTCYCSSQASQDVCGWLLKGLLGLGLVPALNIMAPATNLSCWRPWDTGGLSFLKFLHSCLTNFSRSGVGVPLHM